MNMLDVLTFPNPFLQQPTKLIDNIDGKLQKFIDDMAATMYAAPGVGLAAIQVGSDKSLIVYDVSSPQEGRSLQVLINPRIISSQGEVLSENEGCLSVPDYRADVKRALQIVVEGLDREGNLITIEAEGFPAIVLQHEIDHLNGTLFIDRLSALKRELYKRRVLKQLKRSAE